jgi:hypothetical protein
LLFLYDMTARTFALAVAIAFASVLAAPALAVDSRTGSAGTGAAGQGSIGPGLPPQIDDMMEPTHRPERFGGSDTTDTGRRNERSHRGTAGDNPAEQQPNAEPGS